MFVEAVFAKKENFPSLNTLFLERECSLTFWLDIRIKKARPNLIIRYSPAEDLFNKNYWVINYFTFKKNKSIFIILYFTMSCFLLKIFFIKFYLIIIKLYLF